MEEASSVKVGNIKTFLPHYAGGKVALFSVPAVDIYRFVPVKPAEPAAEFLKRYPLESLDLYG